MLNSSGSLSTTVRLTPSMAIAEGEIQVRALITGMAPLERGVQAFEMARHPGALKVLIKPGE